MLCVLCTSCSEQLPVKVCGILSALCSANVIKEAKKKPTTTKKPQRVREQCNSTYSKLKDALHYCAKVKCIPIVRKVVFIAHGKNIFYCLAELLQWNLLFYFPIAVFGLILYESQYFPFKCCVRYLVSCQDGIWWKLKIRILLK